MDTVAFQKPIAFAANYPSPLVPMLAPLTLNYIISSGVSGVGEESVFHDGVFFREGRYALLEALKCAGINSDVSVLMPAYHCRSLVEPAVFLKTNILFFSHNKDLQPDIVELKKLVDSADKPVKVLVLPHYFGFPQNLKLITSFCDAENILLIEDCAHAFYGRYLNKPLGSFGAFSIASPRKFFPIENGGILIDNRVNTVNQHVPLKRASLRAETVALLRVVKGLFSRMIEARETNFIMSDLNTEVFLKKSVKVDEGYEYGLKWFKPSNLGVHGYRVSRWLMNKAPHKQIILARRRNYKSWVDEMSGVLGCRVLLPILTGSTVPYVFPLVIEDNPSIVFHRLKKMGVPMWRWEDMAVTECSISKAYRETLIQLPCHQELSDKQLDWMIVSVKKVIASVKSTGKGS